MTTFSTPPLPPRCEAVYPGREAVQCALPIGHADDHRSAYHSGTSVRWPRPAVEVLGSGRVNMAERFAQRPVSLQHDACGARLTWKTSRPSLSHDTLACVLGPHDFQTMHRSANGMMWRASDFPPTAPPTGPLARSVTDGIVRHLESMAAVFGELRDALCFGCREVAASSNPEDGAELEIVAGCPVHGEAAELRRSLKWAAHQHEEIARALGPEYLGPFAPDATGPAVKHIITARKLDDIMREEADIEHPTGLLAVRDLIGQRDGALEHAEELDRLADIVRDMVADVVPSTRERALPLPDVVAALVEAYRELKMSIPE
jgi:hypothetical protein